MMSDAMMLIFLIFVDRDADDALQISEIHASDVMSDDGGFLLPCVAYVESADFHKISWGQ